MESKEKSLLDAVQANNFQLVANLVFQGADVNARNDKGMSCLHLAVEFCSIMNAQRKLTAVRTIGGDGNSSDDEPSLAGYDEVYVSEEFFDLNTPKLLLSFGAKTDVLNNDLKTPLHIAAASGLIKLVFLLVSYGSPLDLKDSDGKTSLMYAVEGNHLVVVRYILSNGYKISGETDIYELVSLSVSSSSYNVFKHLLSSYMVNINDRIDKRGRTLLHLCMLPKHLCSKESVIDDLSRFDISETDFKAKTEIFNHLLGDNIHLDSKCNEGLTVLHLTAAAGFKNMMNILMNRRLVGTQSKLDLNSIANNMKTPLVYAVECGNTDIVQLLLFANAKMDYCDANGKSLLMIACELDDLQIIRCLVDKFKQMKNYHKELQKALEFSVENKILDVVEELLKSFDILLSKEGGKRYADVLSLGPTNIEVIRFLSKFDFNVRFNKKLEQNLRSATVNNYTEVLDKLLTSDRDLDFVDEDGNTLLHLACSARNIDVMSKLISLGCNLNVKNYTGNTVLHDAAKLANPEILKLLIDAGCDINLRNYNNFTVLMLFLKNIEGCSKRIGSDTDILKVMEGLIKTKLKCMKKSCYIELAVKTGIKELVKLILDHHPNPEHIHPNKKQSSVHIAAQKGYLGVMKVLLDSGAQTDCLDSNSDLPIVLAIKKNNLEMVKMLLRVTDCNSYRGKSHESIMHIAARVGNEHMLTELIYAGVDMHVTDQLDGTPFCWLAVNDVDKISRHFLNMGFDVNYLSVEALFIGIGRSYDKSIFNLHLMKLFYCGCYIKPEFMEIVNGLQMSCFSYVFDAYQIEAERFKTEMIRGTNITYSKILNASEEQLAMYAKNKLVRESFKDINTQFPNLSSIVVAKLIKGCIRNELMGKCHNIYDAGIMKNPNFLPKLPYYCVYLILSYLSNSELHLFTTAFPFMDTGDCENRLIP